MTDTPKPLNPKQVERLNAPSTGVVIKWMSRAQTWIFKKTNGKFGNKFLRGAEVGILDHHRAQVREPRDSPLLFLQEGKRIVLVASQGGRATNPMWYLNLEGQPRHHVPDQEGTTRAGGARGHRRRARRVLAKLDAMYPDFANYRSYTDRGIPILICDPA